jgi:F0F1-type ATP synthase membrane subunit c/vacuolar-type H+-ATPase subunit K
MTKKSKKPEHRVDRWVTAAFGLFFISLAIAMLLVCANPRPVGGYVAAFVVGGLGVDAVLSAAQNRRSLLSRIGPLP